MPNCARARPCPGPLPALVSLASLFALGVLASACSDEDPDDGPLVARGRYLVHVVSLCADCHTPRLSDGSPDFDRLLAGSECFIDSEPTVEGTGCLHSRNLTNHPTGLANRSDAEIKRMFQEGIRPNGDAVWPVMPYWSFHNMTDEDADAIVAYLRTVPGVDHQVPRNEPPFDVPLDQPAPLLPPFVAPGPESGDPNFASAARGRYLATMAGLCMECHTPELQPGIPDFSRPFAGGREYGGLPVPPFNVSVAVAPNITPHETGIAGYSVEDIKTILRDGMGPSGDGVCPPMPAGPFGGYGFLSDGDLEDIAHYILSLPPIDNPIVAETCTPPAF